MSQLLKIPVMKVEDNLLISIQVNMTDEMAIQLQNDILNKLVESGARGVLIDISTLDMIDSFLARSFSEIARMVSILNSVAVVVGMRPAIALTLVELGLGLPDVHTALNVDLGMELLEKLKRESSGA